MITAPRRFVIVALVVLGACYNRHVNGTTLQATPPCTRSWTAVVINGTDRVYDLYIGNRVVGTADPRSTTRVVIDPQFGQLTPQLRQSPTTRDIRGPYIAQNAMRMVCE